MYVNSINDQAEYDKLNQIAPTVAAPAGTKNVYGVTWKDQVELIAKATGTTDRGTAVIAETEQLLDDAAAEHPAFKDKVITAGVFSSGKFSAWLPSDPRMQLLKSLGFSTNPKIDELDNGDFYVEISGEQLDRMNADLILLAAEDDKGKVDPGVQNNAVFNNLPTVKAGHIAYFGGAPVINTNTDGGVFSSAFSIGGPLGIKYAVSQLGPKLESALGS